MGKVTKMKKVKPSSTITKRDMLRIRAGLESVSRLQGVKFAYVVAKNLHIIFREVKILSEILTKALKFSDAFSKFEEERVALCELHAKKDDKGKVIKRKIPRQGDNTEDSEYVIEDRDSFERNFENLKKEHQAAIDEREIQMKEYESLLDEPCDLNFHKVSKDVLPENITGEQLFRIMEIVSNEDE